MKSANKLENKDLMAWQGTCSMVGWMRCLQAISIVSTLLVSWPVSAQTTAVDPPAGMARFKSGVDLVTVSAVVRDQKGRVVTDLVQTNFELLDNGEKRPITDFRAERAGVSVALLFDASGSMQVSAKIESARQAARHVLAWMKVAQDELAIYSFDTTLRQLQPFGPYREDAALERSMVGIAPFGMTSLHDAIAATAKELKGRPYSHRAVVVLTDGVDNASRLTAPEVSGIASSIDVPVYILAVVSPLDHTGASTAVNSERPIPVGDLADLARWTGGEFFVTSAPSQTSLAARQIIEELRHQYVLAFEPAARPGWHPLEVRAQHGHGQLVVRARSGYMAGQPRTEGISPASR
jgi:Ca-activated chloride channel homolog